jgi:hypothetical protein
MEFLYKDTLHNKKPAWFYQKKVRGWWKDSLFEIYDAVTRMQQEQNIKGNTGEIGTWYGRSLIPLRNFANDGETVVGVDNFVKHQKQQVIDLLEDVFETNDVLLLEGLSQNKNVRTKLHELKPFRFFYIDGGHKYEMALSDLKLGEEILHDQGLMFMDDYDNPHFKKDVLRAINDFISDSDYVIAFTSCLQAFICKEDMVTTYTEMMDELGWNKSQEKVFNVSYYEHPNGVNSWRR